MLGEPSVAVCNCKGCIKRTGKEASLALTNTPTLKTVKVKQCSRFQSAQNKIGDSREKILERRCRFVIHACSDVFFMLFVQCMAL